MTKHCLVPVTKSFVSAALKPHQNKEVLSLTDNSHFSSGEKKKITHIIPPPPSPQPENLKGNKVLYRS